MHDCQGHFSQDFPGPGIFKKNPGLSRRRGNPVDRAYSAVPVAHTGLWTSKITVENLGTTYPGARRLIEVSDAVSAFRALRC